jgi:hypothetical protein
MEERWPRGAGDLSRTLTIRVRVMGGALTGRRLVAHCCIPPLRGDSKDLAYRSLWPAIQQFEPDPVVRYQPLTTIWRSRGRIVWARIEHLFDKYPVVVEFAPAHPIQAPPAQSACPGGHVP